MDDLILALKAAGEPTRLRILLLLHRSELTVSEICRVLGQSQPRVSRHLKLLCDAGLLIRKPEGTSAYYRHASSPFADHFLATMRPLADLDTAVLVRDQQHLSLVRNERAELAVRSGEIVALEAALVQGRKANDDDVEAAMVAIVGDRPLGHLLDIGTGTGRILELFASRIDGGTGLELSREMLNLARTRLDAADLGHCAVRLGNAYNHEVEASSVGFAVLHHVLHFLDEPARAIEEAARTIAPEGCLLIVDYAPHEIETLRSDHGHRRLGFSEQEVIDWCQAADLGPVITERLDPPTSVAEGLTINIWLAEQRTDALMLHNLKVAQ